MSVLTEDWARDIEDVLFDGQNQFIKMSRSHDEFVVNKTVHVPQAGSLSAVEKNITTLPAVIEQRDDTTLDYSMDVLYVKPVLVENIEEIQISYNKRDSIMSQRKQQIQDRVALETIHDWSTATAANIVSTSGSASTVGNAPDDTANRFVLTVADVIATAKKLDKMNVPDDGNRVLMLPSNMYYELFTIQDLLRDDIMQGKTLPEGVMKAIMGFKIMKRNFTVTYATGGAKNPVNSTILSTDNHGGIAWHPTFVAKALGKINVFLGQDQPEYYGDLMSMNVIYKASKLRTDEAGIVNIRQAS